MHLHTVWEKAPSHQKWLCSAGKKVAGWCKGTTSIFFQELPINAPSPYLLVKVGANLNFTSSLIPSLNPLLCIRESTFKTYPSSPGCHQPTILQFTLQLVSSLPILCHSLAPSKPSSVPQRTCLLKAFDGSYGLWSKVQVPIRPLLAPVGGDTPPLSPDSAHSSSTTSVPQTHSTVLPLNPYTGGLLCMTGNSLAPGLASSLLVIRTWLKHFFLRSENPNNSKEMIYASPSTHLFLYNSFLQCNAALAGLPMSLHPTAGFTKQQAIPLHSLSALSVYPACWSDLEKDELFKYCHGAERFGLYSVWLRIRRRTLWVETWGSQHLSVSQKSCCPVSTRLQSLRAFIGDDGPTAQLAGGCHLSNCPWGCGYRCPTVFPFFPQSQHLASWPQF